MPTVLIDSKTDIGKQRQDNQDTNICINVWKNSFLLAAIDGVGGYAGGKRAAEIAKETIIRYVTAVTKGEPERILAEAITNANNKIVEERNINPQFSRMSCVLSVALIDSDKKLVYFGHLGDTRIYIYRDGKLKKITHDHSIVGYREEIGELTELEAMNHPQRNEILRVLGDVTHLTDDINFIETGIESLLSNDILLLCSDGLTDMLTKAEIENILGKDISIEEILQELIDFANSTGGKDNITVVIAKIVENASDINNEPEIEENNVFLIKLEEKNGDSKTQVNDRLQSIFSKIDYRVLIRVIITLIIFVTSILYFFQPKQVINNELKLRNERILTKLIDNNSDSILYIKNSNPTRNLVIILSKPISIKKSICWTGKGNLVLQADSLNYQPAIIIKEGSGDIVLKNITLKGFEVAIKTSGKQKINLDNIKTENVRVAILNETKTLPSNAKEVNNHIEIVTDTSFRIIK